MRSPLHTSTGLLLASVSLLLGGIGVVSAQESDPTPPPAAVAPLHRAWATSTTAAPTTTTEAPTTTTTAPPPPPTVATTAPPAPAPRPTPPAAPATTAPPAPPTTSAPAPAAPTDLEAYAEQLLREVIPSRWLAAVPARVDVIAGSSSWSNWSGLIEIGDFHLTRSPAKAKNVLAHEWGHQVAWHYGTDVYNGAPPAGFPYSGGNGEEFWADCVGAVLSGIQYPTGGLPPCTGAAHSFTAAFFAAAPGPRLR